MRNTTHRRWAPLIVIALLLASVIFLALPAKAVPGNGNGAPGSGDGFVPVTLCHATGSASNPYVTITVDNAGQLNGHSNHDGDIIPAPAGGCPVPPTTTVPETTTTTAPEVTTTTVAEQETTTTTDPGPGPGPRSEETTTTTLPFDSVPIPFDSSVPPVVTIASAPPITELPFTGVDAGMLGISAAAFAALGGALIGSRRKG